TVSPEACEVEAGAAQIDLHRECSQHSAGQRAQVDQARRQRDGGKISLGRRHTDRAGILGATECPGRAWASLGATAESLGDQPRRSASQMPEQEPPLQEPAPLAPARRPLPTALLSPALTLTITAPFLPTLPEMLMGAVPALPRLPLLMRTG